MPYLKSEMHFMKCETKKTRHLRLPFGKGHAHAENCSYINFLFPCHKSDDKGGNRCRNNGRRPPHRESVSNRYKGIIMPVSDMDTLTPSTHTTIVIKQVISCRVLSWDKEKFFGE